MFYCVIAKTSFLPIHKISLTLLDFVRAKFTNLFNTFVVEFTKITYECKKMLSFGSQIHKLKVFPIFVTY